MYLYHYIGLVALGIFVVAIGIMAYWSSIIGWEEIPNWDYEYKFLPVYLFFAGIGVLVIAGIVNHQYNKQGKSHWTDDL